MQKPEDDGTTCDDAGTMQKSKDAGTTDTLVVLPFHRSAWDTLVVLPLLPEDEVLRGNVRMFPGGRTSSITVEEADRMRVRRRQNRPGLLYDPSVPGCAPCTWPHVIRAPGAGRGEYGVMLEGCGGAEPTLVDVQYTPTVPTECMAAGDTMLSQMRAVRGEDTSAGLMVGVGDHMRRTGFMGPFYLTSEGAKRAVAAAVEGAGRALHKGFAGRGVGWEEMLQRQEEAWPRGTPWWPQHWAASEDLGNAMHIDPDGSRSFAVWYAERGHAGVSDGWWFLFPTHGLAVELAHGTWISWDGRVQRHCTALPCVGEGDRLCSVFTSLPHNVLAHLDRGASLGAVLRDRGEVPRGGEKVVLRGRALFDSLVEGQSVRIRVAQPVPLKFKGGKRARIAWGKEHVRWAPSVVKSVASDHLIVRNRSSGKDSRLSIGQVSNTLVVE